MTDELTNELKSSIFSPQETADASVKHSQYMAKTRGKAMALPIPDIGDYFVPVRPGQIAGVIAQTSHYKSSFLRMIERKTAEMYRKEEGSNKVLFHISTEEDIEELGIHELARYSGIEPEMIATGRVKDWDKLIKHAVSDVGTLPIFRIGLSLTRDTLRYEDMYLTNIFRALELSRRELDLNIMGIFVDYLQALPYDPEIADLSGDMNQRRLQVRKDAYRIREASKYFKCPVWVGIQAKQSLGGAISSTVMIPGQYDGNESSDIAQRFDRLISLWLPKQTYPVGKLINFGNARFVVEEDLMFIRVLKQRGNLPAGKLWPCRVNYEKNEIQPDVEVFDFEED